MKHCLVTLAALLAAASSFAQGTVNFNNRITGVVDAIVTYQNGAGGPIPPGTSSGTPIPANASFVAQLYASAPGGTLAAVGAPIPFRNPNAAGAGAGYINPAGAETTLAIPGVPGGATASVKMVAWATMVGATYEAAVASGLGGVGESGLLSIATGGGGVPPSPAANMLGLQAFSISTIVPEPSMAALGLLGAGLLLIRRKK